MPTYEYRCTKCGEHFEVYQSFTDEPLKKHAECGGKLNKVLGSVGIVFKGSGFYRTDNRGGSKRSKEPSKEPSKATGKDPDGGDSSSSTSTSKSDSKTDSQSGSKSAEAKTA